MSISNQHISAEARRVALVFWVAIAVGGLQACGGGSSDSEATDSKTAQATASQSTTSTAAPTAGSSVSSSSATSAAVTAALAALPAPYDQGDYARGKRLYNRCVACHTFEPNRHGVGPTLYNILDQKAGKADFRYSPALRDSNLTWDIATLDAWIENPAALVAGNRMNFVGIKKETDRRDLMSYMLIASTPTANGK